MLHASDASLLSRVIGPIVAFLRIRKTIIELVITIPAMNILPSAFPHQLPIPHLTKGPGAVPISLSGYNQVNRTSAHNWGGTMNMSYPSTTPTAGLTGTANIETEPVFVHRGSDYGTAWTGGDLRLTDESPCIDEGIFQVWMTGALDLDGRPRIWRVVDMGAYEYQPPRGTTIILR